MIVRFHKMSLYHSYATRHAWHYNFKIHYFYFKNFFYRMQINNNILISCKMVFQACITLSNARNALKCSPYTTCITNILRMCQNISVTLLCSHDSTFRKYQSVLRWHSDDILSKRRFSYFICLAAHLKEQLRTQNIKKGLY